MTPDDRSGFATRLGAMLALYRREVTEQTLQTWWRVLEPFPLTEVAAAMSRFAANQPTRRGAPEPADIACLINGSGQDRAAWAWSTVETAIRRVGPNRSIAFDDPLIHVCISELGGWRKLNRTVDRELPFVARDFMARYQAQLARGVVPQPPRLTGLYPDDPVALIGDPVRAQAVHDAAHQRPPGLHRITIAAPQPQPQPQRLPQPHRDDE